MELIVKNFDELSLDELYAVMRARSEVFVVEQQIVYQDFDFNDQHSTHMFFLDNGRVASYLRVIPPGVKYPEASIGRVLTLRPYRHGGLSRRLLQLAIEFVASNYHTNIKIEAQAYLKKFYESFGFRAISEEFILEDIVHIEMLYDELKAPA